MSREINDSIPVDITTFKLPQYIEITNVGLYLKQVVRFINDSLQPALGITVTETMLSNYVKMHLVSNPVKKLYSRDQIASLMIITLSKTALSLEDVQLLLNLQGEYSIEETYGFFRESFSAALSSCFGTSRATQASENGESDAGRSILSRVINIVAQELFIKHKLSEIKETMNL